MTQLEGKLFVDCTMTNIQNFRLANIVGFVPDAGIWKDAIFVRFPEAM